MNAKLCVDAVNGIDSMASTGSALYGCKHATIGLYLIFCRSKSEILLSIYK